MDNRLPRPFPCVVVMAMREERFHTSAIRGVLDAYQNSGFHITSPPEPKTVFIKRVKYVVELIRAAAAGEGTRLPERIDPEAMEKFFRIMVRNFQEKGSHLVNFLTACSHGNIRMALELFRGFVVSGYTNVQEMIASDGWTLQTHQVVKPFMIPSRFFYSEALSRIPNVFQIRSKTRQDHVPALRILESLLQGHERKPPFVPVAKLSVPFIESFAMKEDFQLNMDVLLKHSLIEANNRLDVFDDLVDSVRITSYGVFVLRALSHDFTYLELTSEDCAIADLQVANEIAELSDDQYRFYVGYKAMERVEVRLRRAAAFLQVSRRRGRARITALWASADWIFTRTMRVEFDRDKVRVMRSARRNVPKKSYV